MEDLWPDEFDAGCEMPPIIILREQARQLAKKTNGLIDGFVAVEGDEKSLTLFFYLKVPALEGYTYRLLLVKHPLDPPYPLEVTVAAGGGDSEVFRAGSKEEFLAVLRRVFSSPATKRLVAALMANAQAVTA